MPSALYLLTMVYPDGTEYSSLSAPDFMSVVEDNRVFEHTRTLAGGTTLGAGRAEGGDARRR
jgi:hypothetical protein